jgi:hypothetical protein
MKIYKLREFLELPIGTIFYEFMGHSMYIKQDSIIEDDYLDFYFIELFNNSTVLKKQRYGSPELDDEFEVLEKEDLLFLKNHINTALIVKGLKVDYWEVED